MLDLYATLQDVFARFFAAIKRGKSLILIGKYVFIAIFVSELWSVEQSLAWLDVFKICSKFVQNSDADFDADRLDSTAVCVQIGGGLCHVPE